MNRPQKVRQRFLDKTMQSDQATSLVALHEVSSFRNLAQSTPLSQYFGRREGEQRFSLVAVFLCEISQMLWGVERISNGGNYTCFRISRILSDALEEVCGLPPSASHAHTCGICNLFYLHESFLLKLVLDKCYV